MKQYRAKQELNNKVKSLIEQQQVDNWVNVLIKDLKISRANDQQE